jgi:glutathione synthase/RimK-type ligase-like ATP-grasp enzyme
VQSSLEGILEDAQVDCCPLNEIGYFISNESSQIFDLRNNRSIDNYDLVFFRGKMQTANNEAATIASYMQSKGIKYVSTAYGTRRAVGKVAQMYQFSSIGCSIPITVSAAANYMPKLIREHLDYPVILKDVNGSHGNDNYLLNTEEELQKILDNSPNIKFMAQEFIKNEGDYRILIIGNDYLIIHRLARGNSHLNNTSAGGTATVIDHDKFPAKIVEEAQKIAKVSCYEITGIDAIIDTDSDKHYFLEMNSQPQLLTGAAVAEKKALLGKYFADLLA